jgi:hypothetical protein
MYGGLVGVGVGGVTLWNCAEGAAAVFTHLLYLTYLPVARNPASPGLRYRQKTGSGGQGFGSW